MSENDEERVDTLEEDEDTSLEKVMFCHFSHNLSFSVIFMHFPGRL